LARSPTTRWRRGAPRRRLRGAGLRSAGLEGAGRIAAVLAARDLHKLNNAFFRPGLLRFCMTVVKKLNTVAVRRGLLSFCR
jgi:hypothetical protein